VKNDDLAPLVTITGILEPATLADATPEVSTPVDLSDLEAGARHVLVLDAFETQATNTGGTWVVEESATSGGVYTTASTVGSLAATGETAGVVRRKVSVLPNPDMPWLRVTFTGAGAETDVIVSAILLSIPRAL